MTKNKIHSEITELILDNLNHWRNNTRSSYKPSNSTLLLALHQQRRIGWDSLIEGFWSKAFYICQKEHLELQNNTKSTILLLSKVQRRIWQIAWRLWDHRNKILHDENKSFQPSDIQNINKKIQYEWKKNVDTLHPSYSSLFGRQLHTILTKSHVNKLNWLITVWSVRELQNPLYLTENTHPQAEPMSRYQYLSWKQNI